jgi:ribonuclease III
MTSQESIEGLLGVTFKTKSYLKEALTHKSINKGTQEFAVHNERLEFFGDAVLKLIVTEYLFHLHPDYNEGQLSKLRSKYISDKHMEAMAKSLNLGEYIEMSAGEEKSGGQFRPSILANAMEAVLGACYLDQGFEVTKDVFLRLFEQSPTSLELLELEDYKSILQERCQKKKVDLPLYRLIKSEGPEHDCLFYIEAAIFVNTMDLVAYGSGKTKKEAEQRAANQLLDLFLKIDH